mmetsp:Transcript_4907/g.13189  ORF Transcript_4907/g.13189 Transcript_4907/m.13189 type:complete len:86 (-) Transcript_4907:212-469(-)
MKLHLKCSIDIEFMEACSSCALSNQGLQLCHIAVELDFASDALSPELLIYMLLCQKCGGLLVHSFRPYVLYATARSYWHTESIEC